MEFQFQIFDNDRYNYSRLFGGGGSQRGQYWDRAKLKGGGEGGGYINPLIGNGRLFYLRIATIFMALLHMGLDT